MLEIILLNNQMPLDHQFLFQHDLGKVKKGP